MATKLNTSAARIDASIAMVILGSLTMRLSDVGLRPRQTRLIYPDHRLTPFLPKDATRDRSNRWLGVKPHHS